MEFNKNMFLRKFLLIAILLIVGISAGCSDKEKEDSSVAIHAIVLKNTMWVKRQNLDEFIDVAINNYNSNKIQLMIRNRRFYLVNSDTRVIRSGGGDLPEGIVKIFFEEGEYQHQTGYARTSQVIPEEKYFNIH